MFEKICRIEYVEYAAITFVHGCSNGSIIALENIKDEQSIRWKNLNILWIGKFSKMSCESELMLRSNALLNVENWR